MHLPETFFLLEDWMKKIRSNIGIVSWQPCWVELLLGQLEHRKNCRHILAAGRNRWTKSRAINMEDTVELSKMWPDISITIPKSCEFTQHHPGFSRHFALKKKMTLSPKSVGCHSRSWAGAMHLQMLKFLKLRNRSPSQSEKKSGPGLIHWQWKKRP